MSDYQVSPIPYVHKECELKLGLGLGLGLGFGAGSALRTMPLGLNLALIQAYGGRPFANVLHGTGRWQRLSGGGAYTQDKGLLNATVSTDRFRLYLFDGNAESGWINGTYTVRNPDGLKIGFGNFDNSLVYQAFTTSTSFTVNLSPSGGNGVYLFVEGSVTNTLGNLQVIMPGHTTSYDAGNVFTSDFLAFITACKPSTIRFMDWNHASHTLETDWADRPDVTTPLTTRSFAVADAGTLDGGAIASYESMFDLCSRVGANPWICIPPRASNDWVTGFANFAASRIPAGKKLYLELGNETWNGAPPWINGVMWITYLNHTKRVGVHNGSGQFALTAHGFVEDQNVRGFWTKNNASASVNYAANNNSNLYSGAVDLYVHVVDANNFTLKTSAGGAAATFSSDLVDIIFFDPDEAGKSTNVDTNHAQRCIEIWDIVDPIIGASNIKHICATQAANAGKTTTRMAYPGMSSRVDAVAVAPYFTGNFWMGRIATASGTLTPAVWSNLTNSAWYIGVYATGSTPTISDVINGTGTGYVGKTASTTYTTTNTWLTVGAGLSAISVVNGTTYDVHFVWEDTSGDRFRNYLTVTASASVTNTYLTDLPRNIRMRTEANIKYTRTGTYPQHYAASGGKPIICYETALGMSSTSAPAELETIMSTFYEDAEAGECIKNSLGIIASSGISEGCYYSDARPRISFALANFYTDTTDPKYTAYTSLNGFVTKGSGYLTIPDQTAVGGQSAPGAYPTVLCTFPNSSLTYYIYSGNDNGCYDISGNTLRIINGNGTPWTDPQARYVKVYATNGHDSYIFRVNANSGNWVTPNAVVDIDYQYDRAYINGVTYDSIAAAVSAGALTVDGTHSYVTLGASLGTSYTLAAKGLCSAAQAGAGMVALLDDGNDGTANDEAVRLWFSAGTPSQSWTANIFHLGVTSLNIQTGTTSAGAAFRMAARCKTSSGVFYYNGVSQGTSGSVVLPTGINTLNIGDRWAKDTPFNGTIYRVAVIDADLNDTQVGAIFA